MKRGFTLIELLVVVLMIAILAAIAVPLYTITVEKGKATEIVKLTRDIYDATERFDFRHNGTQITSFWQLDITLRGDLTEDEMQFSNPYGTFSIDNANITGRRRNSPPSVGEYYFVIPRAGGNVGIMFCCAAADTDAFKICSGLSTTNESGAGQCAGGLTGFRM